MQDKLPESAYVGEDNTFGDNLMDNLPEPSPRGSASHVTVTHETTDPAERLAQIDSKYRLVPPNHNVVIECAFRYKTENNPSEFFRKSKFVVWRDRSVVPNLFYWERKESEDAPSPYKYGPFKELSEAFDDIRDLFGINARDIERVT